MNHQVYGLLLLQRRQVAECVVGFWGVCARRLSVVVYAGVPRIEGGWGLLERYVPTGPTRCMECCGGVLLSHTLPGAVPSALAGLASRFGMETGRFPAAMTTTSGSTSILIYPQCGGCVGCDPHSGDEHP